MNPPAGDAAARLRFVARQLAEFRDRAERDGFAVPLMLEAALAVANGRLQPPQLPAPAERAQPYAMTYSTAAECLGVSPRTVERLVASGSLPSVGIGVCARIRVADLEAYVAGLPVRRLAG